MIVPTVTIDFSPKRVRTKPEGNRREHHYIVYRRGEAQKLLVHRHLSMLSPPELPAIITFVRIAAGELDDDNLPSSLKRVRDTVAKWLGCGDSPSDPVTWKYKQERCSRGEQYVRIEWVHDER